MTENDIYELNQLPEIDPNYERQTVNERQTVSAPDPARSMTKKAWFKSLFLPVFSMLASAVLPLWDLYTVIAEGDVYYFFFIPLFGVICGGIVPTVLIVRYRLDLSKYFRGKMILFFVWAVGFVFASLDLLIWHLTNGGIFWVLLIVTVIAELIFTAVQNTSIKTKLCLVLSSLVWGYLGLIIDVVRSYI